MYDYRLDKLLSVWIFIYTIFYIFRMAPYNPIILLYLAVLFAWISSIYIYINTENMTYFYAYIGINFLFKQIPIMIINNDKISYKDIVFTLAFIFMYIMYMNAMNQNIICTYKDLILFVIDKNEKNDLNYRLTRI
jgi:hypothetical protein